MPIKTQGHPALKPPYFSGQDHRSITALLVGFQL
jgi:hypothetical protein